jgi:hypothetical protein
VPVRLFFRKLMVLRAEISLNSVGIVPEIEFVGNSNLTKLYSFDTLDGIVPTIPLSDIYICVISIPEQVTPSQPVHTSGSGNPDVQVQPVRSVLVVNPRAPARSHMA